MRRKRSKAGCGVFLACKNSGIAVADGSDFSLAEQQHKGSRREKWLVSQV
jgi:hypothetical protein